MLVGKLVNNVMILLIKFEEEWVDEDKDVFDMDEVVGYVVVYV